MNAAPTAVYSPRSLATALAVLADRAPVTVLAGGTDLMVELRTGRTQVASVLDLWGVEELRFVRAEAGGVRIGALTTITELRRQPSLGAWPLLAACAADFAAEQIRNRATVGGSLGTASPAADLGPVLWALDAVVRLRSRDGVRDLPIPAFLLGYRRTARRADELIESVWLPGRLPTERGAFVKVGTRDAQSIAKVVVALVASRDAGSGQVTAVRAAAGAVAERTVELASLQELVGRRPDAAALLAVSRVAASRDCAPIDDVRSSAVYRRHALQRVVCDMLTSTLEVPLEDG